ncbi:MAG: AbrB/MazE/SpoVT family DNA-binding domain-containing protein [Tepidisphaeraceae bacterium]
MKIKHLTKQGNSLAIIIDKPILDMADINEQTPLKLSLDGRKITLEPISEEEIEKRFLKAADEVEREYGRAFKRLAEK